MHKAQVDFCNQVGIQFPEHFQNAKSILDVGSLDVNGNNRYLFNSNSIYLGIDITKGPNVDIVKPIHTFFPGIQFDIVISTEMLEHDIFWKDSLQVMYDLIKSNGLLLITCAAPGRAEHGTKNTSPDSSPATNDYYFNISKKDFLSATNKMLFTAMHIHENNRIGDLYFWGIKQ